MSKNYKVRLRRYETNFMKSILLTSLFILAVCLSGCGQSGKLFIPGDGKGYYKTHSFNGTPIGHKEKGLL